MNRQPEPIDGFSATGGKELAYERQMAQYSFDRISDSVIWLDENAQIILVNGAYCKNYGYTKEELLSLTVFDIDPLFTQQMWDRHWQEILRLSSFTFETENKTKSGLNFPVEVTVNLVELGGKKYNCAIVRNITERKLAEQALHKKQDQLETILQTTRDGFWLVDAKGRFIIINDAYCRMSGYTQAELFNMQVADIEIIENTAEVEAHMQKIMRIGADLFETKHRRKDGTIFDLEVSTTVLQSDNETQLIVFLRDISARKSYEELILQKNNELERLSITDGLTNIANRRHFDEVLTKEYTRHARSGAKLSLIIMDIDYFKAFNDYYGHIEGDECLRQIGRMMAVNAAREADLPARYGGEEFVCILPETDSEGAKIIAEKILHSIRNLAIPHAKSKVAKVVTASLGVVSVTCCDGSSAVDIMIEADKLLYRAKSNGRNRVECLFERTLEIKGGTR